MRTHLLPALFAVAAAFAGGLLSPRLFERAAHAEPSNASTTVYVPSEGLTFRTFDGRVVAKLSYDERGGIFDVYRDAGQPSARSQSAPLSHRAPSTAIASSPRQPVDLGF